MRRTRFGRQIYMLGENRTAARAAALPITLLTAGAFGIASLYTAGSGILIGATSANASLLLTGSYTYDAIAAALVGGNAVTGGRGSVARAVVRRDLHRDDLRHAAAPRLLDRRADPRPRASSWSSSCSPTSGSGAGDRGDGGHDGDGAPAPARR